MRLTGSEIVTEMLVREGVPYAIGIVVILEIANVVVVPIWAALLGIAADDDLAAPRLDEQLTERIGQRAIDHPGGHSARGSPVGVDVDLREPGVRHRDPIHRRPLLGTRHHKDPPLR